MRPEGPAFSHAGEAMSMFVTIVLDGVGIGAQADAADFGDDGSDTLGHVCAAARPDLPHLTRLGLGSIRPLAGVPPVNEPAADYGRMREVSAGKDSTSGHWELAGIMLDRPFPTYADGFPEALVRSFVDATGVAGVLGNEAASGTDIIRRLGDEHVATGMPILYTSADSVFQVAAHVNVVPLQGLYAICETARERVLVGDHAVGRVIARPFSGASGQYGRISEARKDFSLRPPIKPVQALLREAGVWTVSIGKVADLFAGVGFDDVHKTASNGEGIRGTLDAMHGAAVSGGPTFIWANLVDFDQEFGHRNDLYGFAGALEEFDRAVPELEGALPRGSVMVLTADHGNDPAFPGTDHCREHVPLLVLHDESGADVGLRSTFADHAAAVAAYFDVDADLQGESFLPAWVTAA